jgi:cellulose synthase/poly-beta-1,6-N-acetylglucosamine synthase-like glycosyltransferase
MLVDRVEKLRGSMAFLNGSRKLTRILKDHLESWSFDPESPPQTDPAWPRITVITPSFNQASFLERTILSIHNQNYPNLEHIVIDGGSTDGSVDILHRYQARFHYWRTGRDEGQSDAINIGANHATGKYMMWINSDDMLFPGSLQTMAEVFLENPGIDLDFILLISMLRILCTRLIS